MDPRIQYAKTSDGVNIAYWTLGEGVPVVVPPWLTSSHVQLEWEVPGRREAYEGIAARGAQVIRYDCRGVGMSDRDAIDFSLAAAERDLDAVVERLGLERFAIMAVPAAGGVPYAYAAHHSDRVSSLVCLLVGLRVWLSRSSEHMTAIEPLMDSNWDLYTEILARLLFGWDSANATPNAAIVRASHTPSSFRLAFDAVERDPPDDLLAAIRTPTLLIHQLGQQRGADRARALASRIASCRVAAMPGMDLTTAGAIFDFIVASTAPGEPVRTPEVNLGAVRTILWTDIENHTAMMQRLGDERGREVLREHERITRGALGDHGGTEVKAMGDGFMAWFPSTQKALECAIAVQRAFAEWNAGVGAQGLAPLRVRIGLNAGEPIVEGDDLFGSSVIAAARIASQAKGGEIVVSDVVRLLVAGKGFLFADRGEVALRGFEDPVRLYEVRWREEG